jgi:hypothetical protein
MFAVVSGLTWKVSGYRLTNVVLEVFDCWECRMCGGMCTQGLYFFARLEIGFLKRRFFEGLGREQKLNWFLATK